MDLLHQRIRIGGGKIHLVDKQECRHPIARKQVPHGLGMPLDAVICADHEHRAVERAQRALGLGGKVDVPGGVEQHVMEALEIE